MKIKVNGEEKILNDSSTLLDLIEQLGVKERVMASAVNMEIVKQDAWNNTTLHDGDSIELLDFVGGG